jgi:BirA family biotin operon repressor/biotin-[acetyl-CoA-carboxylase] ligase
MNIDINGGELHWYATVGSTNDIATELASKGAPSGTVVAADTQTAGRGRLGRGWVSPAGRNLYFSVVLRPQMDIKDAPLITLMCAVEAAVAIKRVTDAEVGLKWPNDLQLHGKKLGGILVESRIGSKGLEFIIAGLGVNVNSPKEDFTEPEVIDIATSLFMVTKRKQPRAPLLKAISEGLIEGASSLSSAGGKEDMLSLWRLLSNTIGRQVRAGDPGSAVEGIAEGIDDMGRLLVRSDDGEMHTILTGDVVHL